MLSLLVILCLTLLSLMVWRGFLMRWQQGTPALEPLPRNSSPWLPIALPAAAVYVGMMLVMSISTLFESPEQTPTVSLQAVRWSAINGGAEILIALALLTGAGRVPLRECGVYWDHLDRQLRDGIGGFVASLAPVFLFLLATYWLRTPENQHPFLKLLLSERSVETTLWLLLAAVIVAPLKEELIFRVMLQDGLARSIGPTAAIVLTSVVFCGVHGFPDSIALFPLAVILGYVYDRRQSVLSVVLVHALFNLTNIGILLLEPAELPP